MQRFLLVCWYVWDQNEHLRDLNISLPVFPTFQMLLCQSMRGVMGKLNINSNFWLRPWLDKVFKTPAELITFSQLQKLLNDLFILRGCIVFPCWVLITALYYISQTNRVNGVLSRHRTRQWIQNMWNASVIEKCAPAVQVYFSSVAFYFWRIFLLKTSSSRMMRWSHWLYYMTPGGAAE